jgi:hypothetical protein
MADKKQDILEFFEQMNFEQMIPTQKSNHLYATATFFWPKEWFL